MTDDAAFDIPLFGQENSVGIATIVNVSLQKQTFVDW